MAFDPQACRLVPLSQLVSEKQGTKTAELIVVEHYPVLRSRSIARVNVQNALEMVTHESLQTGSWINIIGYIRLVEQESTPLSSSGKTKKARMIIDATSIWPADGVKIDEYVATVKALQAS
ncbi:hypothetical protein MRB53_041511 [Persea americana]|nr:hypothetical protein MRB53_041511 [Persea americana]